MPLLLKQSYNFIPTPGSMPKSMNQHKVLLACFSFLTNFRRKNSDLLIMRFHNCSPANSKLKTKKKTEESALGLDYLYMNRNKEQHDTNSSTPLQHHRKSRPEYLLQCPTSSLGKSLRNRLGILSTGGLDNLERRIGPKAVYLEFLFNY